MSRDYLITVVAVKVYIHCTVMRVSDMRRDYHLHLTSNKLPTAKSNQFLYHLVQSSVVSYSIKRHIFNKIKAASGDRVIEKRLQFNIRQRFEFLAHELSRIIARGLRLKRCLSGLFQYSVKCSVVPYCIITQLENSPNQIQQRERASYSY